MDQLIDFGLVVEQTRHNGTAGPNRDPDHGNCTTHPSDPWDPLCPQWDELED